MYIIALFDHSLKVELAIKELESHDVQRDSILVLSVDKTSMEKKYLDPFNADGLNLFIPASIGMISMLLGSIYGFVLEWGPIIWALIGLISGSVIGILLDIIWKKKKDKQTLKHHNVDVILMIKTPKEQIETVETILKQHHTIGTSKA